MSDATTPSTLPVNTAAQIVGGVIQALMTGGESAALTYLVAEVPAFSEPILNEFASWLIGLIAEPVQTFLINNATSIVINIQTASEQSQVLAAATALQIAESSGNQAAIGEAVQNAKKAYQKLFQFDGAYQAP